MFHDAATIAGREDLMRNVRHPRRIGTSLHGRARACAIHGEERELPNEEEATQEGHAERNGKWANELD